MNTTDNIAALNESFERLMAQYRALQAYKTALLAVGHRPARDALYQSRWRVWQARKNIWLALDAALHGPNQ